MDLQFTECEDAFRQEARAWLEANVPESPLASGDTAEGFQAHVLWEKKLFAARWAVVSWPKRFGGREASLVEWLIFEEEYYRAGAPSRVTQNGIFLLAPILFEYGTAEQQERILPAMASAQALWAQGWSEPNAGSDLASLKSYGERAEGGFRLYGQKTWCTRGAFCDGLFGLFRTDPNETRHRGLTYFMVPLDAEGVTVRPVARLDGDDGFADVFLDGVFVPDRDILGDANGGWKVAMATTGSERGLTLRSPGRFLAAADRLMTLYRKRKGACTQRFGDAVIKSYVRAEAYRWYTYATVQRMKEGQNLGADSSMNKLYWSQMDLDLHRTALEILGPDAELEAEPWMKAFQFALAGPIYAGTNEIQRNVVAERVLGLPRK